jgi:hypothetical protein
MHEENARRAAVKYGRKNRGGHRLRRAEQVDLAFRVSSAWPVQFGDRRESVRLRADLGCPRWCREPGRYCHSSVGECFGMEVTVVGVDD